MFSVHVQLTKKVSYISFIRLRRRRLFITSATLTLSVGSFFSRGDQALYV